MNQNKILFVWANKDRFGFKPIGLSLLSGLAKREGFETKLFETTEIDFGFKDSNKSYEEAKIFKQVNFKPYNTYKKKINLSGYFTKIFNEFKPSILAFSVLSDEYLIASEITNMAKKIDPNIKVIWGGKYPTLNPEKTLKEFNVNYVCVGEGLKSFPNLLRAFKDNKDTTNIKNIWVNKNGKIIKNELSQIKKEIDDLPYLDWDIFDKRFFYKPFDGKVVIGGDHMLNWGCPYNCSYCINHFYHELYSNKYFLRRYSVKRIIDELVYLKEKYNLEFFKFHDEDFLMRPLDTLKELSEEYRKRVNLPFSIETNPNSVTKEKAKLLKNMNCVNASLGIETGDQKLRKDVLNRIDSREDIMLAFKLLNKEGIRTSSFNMLGIPFETRETYEETIKINKDANVKYPSMAFFYPFEGTKLRDIAIQHKLFFPEGIDKNTDCKSNEPALHFKNLTKQELIEMRNVFVLYVKLPEEYYPFIRRSEKLDEIGKKLRKKLLEIYDNTVFKNNGEYKDDGFKNQYLKEFEKIIKLQ